MLRNLAAALALVLMSQTALGLGLGTLKQSSALNEPFDGRVEILGVTASDLEGIRVRLADEAQFERANVHRNAVLLLLRFKVVNSATGPDYVQITSHEPIREPFLNFLLEMNWANGRMVREYTVLLDPPLYDAARRRTSAPPVVAAPAPTPTPAPAPPTAVTPSRPVIATAAPAPSPAAAPTTPSSYSSDSTIAVEANDTLWSIASANRPNDSTSVQQMMLALLRANPEAFGNDNINILKRGSILRLPEEGATDVMTQAEAIAEVRRQHQLWNEYRDIATETVADAPLVEDEPMDDAEPMADSEPMHEPESMADGEPMDEPIADAEPAIDEGTDARLELVAPGDGDAMGAGAADDGAAEVTLAREELDAQVQENAELQARIAEANEIIDLMSRQVDIKDDELAAYQARLLELGIEAPIDGVADAETPVDGETEAAMDEDTDSAVDMGDGDDEIPVTPGDVPDVDITISDDPDTVPGDPPPGDATPEIDEPEIAMDEGGGTEPDSGGSLLGGLIPQHITNMVPGGAMTILGILGVVLLGAFAALFKLIGGRRETVDAVATMVDEDDPTALTEGFGEDEPITETREDEVEEFSSEDTTEVAPENVAMMETSPELKTLESTAAELAAVEEPEEDPLEEVNVYLAYERFDQAEELVRKVIADHPDEHKYKLRLLEVFYSSNNQAAYEEAARALHDSVGESDPLWESAVAMWTEMSPTRALFAEGAPAADVAPSEEQAPQQVVDITADDEAGAHTMTMAPGSDAVLESTQVGLGAADETDDQDAGSLDFDLGSEAGDVGGDDIFDLTATTDSLNKEEGVLDLTTGEDGDAGATADSMAETLGSALDVGMSDDLSATDEDILDLTAPAPDGDHDLLDVTSAGMLTDDHPDDLLNVTSPGLMHSDEPTADSDLDETREGGGGIDFDISDTVSPAFGADDEVADDDDSMFDITAPSDTDDDAPLDFDIGELDEAPMETDDEDLTLDISGGLDFDSTSSEADSESLDLDIAEGSLDTPDSVDKPEMEAVAPPPADDISEIDTVSRGEAPASEDDELEFDLSLQSSELDDLAVGGDTIGDTDESDSESEIEFDLALEDTTEMDNLVIDETLELPKADTGDDSLDDLAKSMEESMADLDIDDDIGLDDAGELDLSLADTSGGLDLDFSTADDGSDTETSLDFDLEGLDLEEMDQADTVAMDMSGELETTPDEDETVSLPADDGAATQTEADEIDTKLNLAKAYIELGDNDGARSILDEVARDGSDSQQSEAQRLIEQLT